MKCREGKESLSIKEMKNRQKRRLGKSQWARALEAWEELLRPLPRKQETVSPEQFVVSFGKHKGKRLRTLSDKYLQWLLSLNDLKGPIANAVKAKGDLAMLIATVVILGVCLVLAFVLFVG